MKLIYVIGLVLLVALFAKIVDVIRKRDKIAKAYRMSFRETLDLTELPIVTFKNNDKKFNFLLDTGSSDSIINKSIVKELTHSPTGKKDTIYGIEGNKEVVDIINIEISYRDRVYEDNFYAKDLDSAFAKLKTSFGVNLHGILGNSFFQKYRYVINFEELVAYSVI